MTADGESSAMVGEPQSGASTPASRCRRAVARLRSITSAWSEATASAEASRDAAVAEAEASYAAATREAASVFEAAKTEGSAAYERATAEASARCEARLRSLDAKAARERSGIVARLDGVRKKAEAGLRDAKFVVDTVAESGRLQPKAEVDRVRREVQVELERLSELEAAVRRVAGRRVVFDAGPVAPAEGAEDAAELTPPLDRMIMLREDAERAYRRMRLAWAHWLFENGLQVLILGLAVIGAVVSGFSAGLVTGTVFRGLVVGGIVLGAGLAALALLWPLRRLELARMTKSAAPVGALIGEARGLADHAVRSAEAFRAKAEREIRERHEAEIGAQREKYQAKLDRASSERERLLEELDAKIEAERAAAESERVAMEADIESRFGARAREVKAAHDEALASAETRRVEALRLAEERYGAAMQGARSAWREGYSAAAADLAAVTSAAAVCSPPWEEVIGSSALPSERADALAPAVAFGRYRVDLGDLEGAFPETDAAAEGAERVFEPPAMLAFPGPASLLAFAGPEWRESALATVRDVMLRLLTSLPPGKARFTMIDPVGLGQSFAGFMRLADHDEKLVTSRIWTELRHIEQRLADMTEHMEVVIQKYLRNEFETIEAYNDAAGEIAEPYRFLVVADFPKGFSDEAARRLASVAESGARCGVYTIVQGDPDAKLPDTISYDRLRRGATVLRFDGGRAEAEDEVFGGLAMTLESPPDDAAVGDVLDRVGAASRTASRVEAPFGKLAPSPEEVWTGDASEEVVVSIGRAGATKLQTLALGRGTSQHALIAGKTGSGKSTLLHVLITNAGLWYSPRELEFYLVDFKKGVEFKAYGDDRLPHARAVAVESDREFGLSVLKRLDRELKTRGDLFRAHGAQSLAAARRAAPDAHLPRIMLIIDEFQEFFTEDDAIAQDAALLLDRLVRQGRAFGMHVLLGSQTLSGAYTLARSTVGQMAVRIALQCSETDSYLILSEDNAAARLLSRPGEAIYNDANGLLEGNNPFQVAWLPDGDRDAALDSIGGRLASDGWSSPEPQIVFEWFLSAEHERNLLLRGAAARIARGGAEDGQLRRPGPLLAWVGEPVAIKEPTAGSLSRQSGSNLLIVGQQDETSRAMMGAALVGLVAQCAHGRGSVRLIDATPPDDPDAELLRALGEAAAGAAGVDFRAVDARGAAALIAELDEERGEREAGGDAAGSVVLLVHGLQRLRALRKAEDDFSFSFSGGDDGGDGGPDTAGQFATLLRDGPPLGMHAVVWCDTYANLTRTFPRSTIGEFEQRAALQMSATDSSNLIDSPAAGKLGMNRGLLFNEELGTVEKFRPYRLPPADVLARLVASVAGG